MTNQVKENQEKKKIPEIPAQHSYKAFRIMLWLVIVVVFVIALMAVIRQARTIARERALETQVQTMSSQVRKLKEESKQTGNIDVFGRYFVQAYYDTNQSGDDYKKSLSKYLASGVEAPTIDNAKGTKTPASVMMWSQDTQDKTTKLAYLVNYNYASKDKKDNKDKTNGAEIIHFEVVNKNSKYSVVSVPYTQYVPNFKSTNAKKATNNLDGKEQVSATIKENVQNWLDKTFLPKYIDSSDITDVQYIMKNPALLGGSQKYKDINEVDVYKDGNYLIAKVTVDVEDAKTQIDSTQEMTLELRKDGGNKFYVENLKHTLGK
ncbi:hypothetical protein SH83_15390 (plasmid) [Lactiplantibacillus plantarum]|uniref:conjugal transfer protein n=1 Tax=Lactiplantibacillus plantarum TaxID=1590 RepID=UPI000CDC4F52|nr:conjugal transfer protein [Lactiplantibacillus plantarum]AUT20085.1 hypothetical protein SH83_15390 [Lactiplantibacillus plantarum]